MASRATGTLFPVLKNELRTVRSSLWFRPAAFCIAAALGAALLAIIDALLPRGSLDWLPETEPDTIIELLKLLATGMLTVATVTLSVLMLVLSLAAGQVSPRAVPAIMADVVTQNALGTFLATFVYALTALLCIGFNAVTGPGGAALLFLGALLLALNAIRYIVQWAHHVAQILKLNSMVHRIHHHGARVLEDYLDCDATERCDEVATAGRDCMALRPDEAGYVQLIDAQQLHHLACEHDLVVRLCVQEGDFVHPRETLMTIYGERPDDDGVANLRATVVVGFDRSHEGDPRLAVVLLAEIACRALSPGINDPQSALACISYLGSLLAIAGERPPDRYPASRSRDGRLQFVRPDFAAMLERAYRPIMRDGAAIAEVICGIADELCKLAAGVAPVYLEQLVAEAARAQAQGEAALQLEADKQALRDKVARLRDTVTARRR